MDGAPAEAPLKSGRPCAHIAITLSSPPRLLPNNTTHCCSRSSTNALITADGGTASSYVSFGPSSHRYGSSVQCSHALTPHQLKQHHPGIINIVAELTLVATRASTYTLPSSAHPRPRAEQPQPHSCRCCAASALLRWQLLSALAVTKLAAAAECPLGVSVRHK